MLGVAFPVADPVIRSFALPFPAQDNMTLIAVDLRGFLGETPEPSPYMR